MKYRRVGRSGLSVSEIGYGNWLTHGAQIDERQSTECVRAALDAGINYFDTADVNAETRAESILGRALGNSDRDGVVISTKAFFPTQPYGPNNLGLGRKHLTASVGNSLRRLGTDVIDIFMLQRFDRLTPLEETFLALSDLVRQGKILYVAVSEWTGEQIARGAAMAREARVPLIASSPQYSMLWRVIDGGLTATAEREGLSQLIWAPLAQGLLTGKYTIGTPPPAGSRGAGAQAARIPIEGLLTDDLLNRVQRLGPVAEAAGLSLPQLALAWTLQNENVAAAIVGATTPDQIVENSKAAGVELDAEVLLTIDQVLGRAIENDPRWIVSP
jgi:aryl-alcohol dehydrogenase-like predicted oxidoreductase